MYDDEFELKFDLETEDEAPGAKAPAPVPEPQPEPLRPAPANGRCVLISGGDRGIGAAAARAQSSHIRWGLPKLIR